MSYLKFQATQLFTGNEMLSADNVLITDEQGRIESIINSADAGDDIQLFNGILTPGFINAHCHLELSHMKGLIPEKTGLVDFILKIVNERHFPDEQIVDAIEKAEDEMLQNGIVAVGDICNNTSTLPQKLKNRLAYYNFVEVSGWTPAIAASRFEKSVEILLQFKIQNSKFKISIVPHAPYSVSNELWDMIIPNFPEQSISIHNQETDFEDAFFLTGTGDFNRLYGTMNIDTSFFQPTRKSSLQSYFQKLKAAKNILLVHNTFTSNSDLSYLSSETSSVSSNIYYCLCINANRYIENALPPVELIRKQKGKIVIGTDSLASNWSLNILDELKTLTLHFPEIALSELLQWATLNGAKALQMDETLGSFEKGKTPGVLVIEQLENGQITEESKVKRLI